MADATPVHAPKEPKKQQPKAEPKSTPAKDSIPEYPHPVPAEPGQLYKLPNGTIVRQN